MAPTYATASVKPGPLGTCALTILDKDCGLAHGVAGGSTFASVIEQRVGPGQPARKHLGPIQYEPFEIEFGFAMRKPLFDWIGESWTGKVDRKHGSVFACDENMEIRAERTFVEAMITETTIPALDIESKETAWLAVKIAAEMVENKTASGKYRGADPRNPEKMFRAAGFELEIDGLDCSKVARIESFTVRQTIAREGLGFSQHRVTLEPGELHFPDLSLTLAEVSADSWLKWFDDFVVKGNCEDQHEKKGVLTLLNDNRQPLAHIRLSQVGIHRLGAIDAASAKDRHKLATAGLYCESMEFEIV
jgi:hypothetical protein